MRSMVHGVRSLWITTCAIAHLTLPPGTLRTPFYGSDIAPPPLVWQFAYQRMRAILCEARSDPLDKSSSATSWAVNAFRAVMSCWKSLRGPTTPETPAGRRQDKHRPCRRLGGRGGLAQDVQIQVAVALVKIALRIPLIARIVGVRAGGDDRRLDLRILVPFIE